MTASLTEALADRYLVQRELGRGGMATVYLARDLKHDRSVALKVLRQDLAAVIGAERFLAEIKTTAHLQHPHILPLFDSGAANGFLYYVMPYVEGESLRDRLRRERQLPVEDAVRIAREVASALEYAHRHGVIHRDIKPENIMLHDGRALVADFGIALAVSSAADTRMTETGMSLGTPHYMSPEQAMGERGIGPRSDVYALGAVLYEMLVGEPPFTGPTAQAILARVLTETPRPLSPQRHTVPLQVEAAILRALEKLPADRFAGPAEFARAVMNESPVSATTRKRAALQPASMNGRRGFALAALAGAVPGALITWWLMSREIDPLETPNRRFQIVLPDSAPLDFFAPSYYGEGRPGLALTPDGSALIYVARVGGRTQLYSRRLDRAEATPIPGTEGAADPFISPDGAWVGFVVGSELRKVAISGGPVSVVTSVEEEHPQGMTWLPDGRIADHRPWTVSAAGGTWRPVAPGVPKNTPILASYPSVLPDGGWIVLSIEGSLALASLRDATQYILTRDGRVGVDSASVGISGVSPRYLPSRHLLYISDGTLTVQPFDPEQLQVLASPVSLFSGVRQEAWGGAQIAHASDGTLVYAAGADAGKSVVVWVDSVGTVTDTLPLPRGEYFDIWSSPDGRHIAARARTATGRLELRVLDVRQGLARSYQHLENSARILTWWPSGDRIVVRSNWRSVVYSLTGSERPDTLLGPYWFVLGISPKLDYMAAAYSRAGPSARDSAGGWLIPLKGGRWSRLNPYGYGWMNFAPDGKSIAYYNNDGLYVSTVPARGPALQVAPSGADEPEWSPRGDALHYRAGPHWMTVPISTRGFIRAGKPRLLFKGRYLQVKQKSYDVGPDGRFLLLAGPNEETTTRLEVVTNIFSELRRKTGTGPPR